MGTQPSRLRWLAAGLALAALCASAASITVSTQHLGANADGMHNWATTVYNGIREASTDFAITGVELRTTPAPGYHVVPQNSDWYPTGYESTGEPLTDFFWMEAANSFAWIHPIGMGDSYNAQMTFYYTTPAHVDRLGTAVNTFQTDAAGAHSVAGVMPVAAAPAVVGLARLAADGGAGRRVALGVDGPPGRPSFRLQARASLGSGDWEELGRFSVTGAVTTVVATNVAPSRFYRAVAP